MLTREDKVRLLAEKWAFRFGAEAAILQLVAEEVADAVQAEGVWWCTASFGQRMRRRDEVLTHLRSAPPTAVNPNPRRPEPCRFDDTGGCTTHNGVREGRNDGPCDNDEAYRP